MLTLQTLLANSLLLWAKTLSWSWRTSPLKLLHYFETIPAVAKWHFSNGGGRSRLVFHWNCHEKYPLCVAEGLQWCSQMRGVLTGLQVMKFLVFYLLLPIASITAVEWKLNTQKMLLFLGYTERRWYSLPFICCLISATKIPASLVTFM